MPKLSGQDSTPLSAKRPHRPDTPHLDTHVGEDVFYSLVRAEVIIKP